MAHRCKDCHYFKPVRHANECTVIPFRTYTTDHMRERGRRCGVRGKLYRNKARSWELRYEAAKAVAE